MKSGYGQITWKGKEITASRAMFEIWHKRDIKPGYVICHTCDNPPCVNPRHLWEGTHLDNLLDCLRKERKPKKYKTTVRGERVNGAKLKEADVTMIRILTPAEVSDFLLGGIVPYPAIDS
jgi:hypothetical protein